MERISVYAPKEIDGRLVDERRLNAYAVELASIGSRANVRAGRGSESGLTIIDAAGLWLPEPGVYVWDALRLMSLDVASADEVRDDVHSLAELIADELGQDAVYITIQAIEVFLVEPSFEKVSIHA
jgi:hypothetical protein